MSPPENATGNPAATPATPSSEAPLPEARQELLEILTSTSEPLYAILDAARDLAALNWTKESGEEFQSLYDGNSARDLEMFAPYLVRFSKPSPLLRRLVAKAWGQSWGIFVTTTASFPDLRKHFRQFLLVEVEGQDKKSFYFRFYDPRVLRVYLPTCTQLELKQFFGPVGGLLMEGKNATQLLRLWVGARGLDQENVSSEEGDAPHP